MSYTKSCFTISTQYCKQGSKRTNPEVWLYILNTPTGNQDKITIKSTNYARTLYLAIIIDKKNYYFSACDNAKVETGPEMRWNVLFIRVMKK